MSFYLDAALAKDGTRERRKTSSCRHKVIIYIDIQLLSQLLSVLLLFSFLVLLRLLFISDFHHEINIEATLHAKEMFSLFRLTYIKTLLFVDEDK